MKFEEETFTAWAQPLSITEEQRAKNTISMIKSALKDNQFFNDYNVNVFLQGSYANNTNVRTDSDIDVCVMCKKVFHVKYPIGKTSSDYGFESANLTFKEYRNQVKEALNTKFGRENLHDGNKSIKIDENTYRIKADVVPALQFRDYSVPYSDKPYKFREGVYLVSLDGQEVINYPNQHIENGRIKNNYTGGKYKKLVRIMKHIRNDMIEAGLINGDKISSFLVECLIYNIPDNIITENDSWIEAVGRAISFLKDSFNIKAYQDWNEVSCELPLFSPDRKWDEASVSPWLDRMVEFLEV
ncbi:MAG: nucleotidyltransferase [Candidatus Saccharibacteria bacterium]|nr:nucleotidyltransferase [Candidatus Saccharibacteria bacterium]